MKHLRTLLTVFGLSTSTLAARADVPITYQLPVTGNQPADYLVTLAIVDPKNPDWIISTFVAGQPRTVTAANGGKFTEQWNGLDENFMPVPPGEYAVKGIFAPATKWEVDGEYHAIIPKWAGGVSAWLPTPENWKAGTLFEGDPVNSPFRDVAVGPNGVAVFYYQYLENGRQNAMFDLKKPVDYDQFIRSFNSGGAGGGSSVATDGEMVWAYTTDSGHPLVYRADGKSFGSSPLAHRRNAYIPDGEVTDLLALRPGEAAQTLVYVAQRGKWVTEPVTGSRHTSYKVPSKTEFANVITVHDGSNGKVLTQIAVENPQSLASYAGRLYTMHRPGGKWVVSSVALKEGMPEGTWRTELTLPADLKPFDMTVDAKGRFYFSEPESNRVVQMDGTGKILRRFGKTAGQKPGSYDPLTLMEPEKIVAWTDPQGTERLIIVEQAGPNRVAEWNTETGALIRDYMPYQTKANNGYAVDPDDASLIYLPGQREWLVRWKVDYNTRQWTVDAVWPDVPAGQRRGLDKPNIARVNGRLYLASEQNFNVFRLDEAKNQWRKSAGIIQEDKNRFFWNDANDNGAVDAEEKRPTTLPGNVLTYHGQKWLSDLSYIAPAMGGKDVWRAAPTSFDAHGNPVFTTWQKVFTDPIFTARAEGKATAIYGGNELTDNFNSDWMQVDGTLKDGFYVQARGGHSFTANFGAQYKVSRYVPDGANGYKLKWRVGRAALDKMPENGEFSGGMRVFKPINGLLSVIDQSRSGVVLYTEDGLYVDTMFPNETKRNVGIYRQPGEFFAGTIYPNPTNGKIYYATGKFTPFLFEAQNWSLKENPVRRLTTVQPTVSIKTAQIAAPPEMAVTLRGGVGKAQLARFVPALGGASLDGSLVGWEGSQPVEFSSGKEKTVQVRTQYTPDQLLLRWHVRLGTPFEAKNLPPLERIFTHDQGADTVSFYMQGDLDAPAKGPAIGRPGDVRFVLGLFKSEGKVAPVALGMYPHYPGKDARPQNYRTPVGTASFAHVGPVPGIKLGHTIDEDGKGFVIAASIPRSAIPALTKPFGGDIKTLVNFDANLGGHEKFWWANSDGSANRETYDEPSEARLYPGSWAPAQFQGLAQGHTVRNWQVLGPFGGPGAEKFSWDPQNKVEIIKFFDTNTFPPDNAEVDLKATYQGAQLKGYWPDPKNIGWKPATIKDLDTRVQLGGGGQVWYGATWIYAPTETEVELKLYSHRQTYVTWHLNEMKLDVPVKDYVDDEYLHRTTAKRKVTLQAGWNQVFFRTYNTGYAPFKIGVGLDAPAEKLWPLRFANTPPTP